MLTTLDHILGTQAKVRLARVFYTLDSSLSGREAQRLAGVRSMSGAGRALRDLTDLGIVTRARAGGTYIYSLNRKHVLTHSLSGLFRAEERQFDTLREILHAALHSATPERMVLSVVLFGSLARGEAKPDSDVDLLVVVRQEGAINAIREALLQADREMRERLGMRGSPYVITRDRAKTRVADGDPLMSAVLSEGRTVLGMPFDEVIAS